MSSHEIEYKIRELRQLQSLIEEAQEEAETIKDVIKAEMGTQEELRAGEYRVTWKMVKSARMDAKAIQEELPDVAQRYIRSTVCSFPHSGQTV